MTFCCECQGDPIDPIDGTRCWHCGGSGIEPESLEESCDGGGPGSACCSEECYVEIEGAVS